MAERKNTGLAVSDAQRLNDCYHELSEAIAARPEMPGDRKRWHYDYAALEGGPAGAEREAWNHKCGSKNIAEDALRGAVMSGNLQLWTNGPKGEAKVDRHELKELTFRTFASGTYQPDNRRLDNAGLAESPLWVKEADWQQYMVDLWTVRYGIDWANPAPPDDKPLLPPDAQFVTLSHALTWIAFGVSMDNDHLHEVLAQDRFGEHDPQEAVANALEELLALACKDKLSVRGKYLANRDDDAARLDTAPIEPIKFTDFRQFSYLENELRHGHGLLSWREGSGQIFHDTFGSKRRDGFAHVTVNRADLLREFPPPILEVSERNHFRCGQPFSRDDPATIAPWWSVNQALAWIACGIPSYVEHVGEMETKLFQRHPLLMTQATVEDDMRRCDEALAFVESSRASWPQGKVLGHAGRALLAQIESNAVKPATSENGKGRPMTWHEFAGIGLSETGGDWLNLNPQPLFSSAEIIAAFPACGGVIEASAKPAGKKSPEVGRRARAISAPMNRYSPR